MIESAKKTRLKEQYEKKIIPKLMERFGYKNRHEVPYIEKIIVNVGMGQALREPALAETVKQTLRRITGQEPVMTKAKKSISGFKLRGGQVIGARVTLRGSRMYEFLDRFLNVTLPRVRDFRGIPAEALDGKGNITIGVSEHIVFPEVSLDEVERTHGLEIVMVTSAKTDEEACALLTEFGFPFKKE